ncbi:MAG TPA: S41 family peptidase [Gammaproteobacteria bacterium]|nr:S41 family peptidase [Gammaproteobacteria bacterium]
MKISPRMGMGLLAGLALGVSLSLGHGVFADRDQGHYSVPLSELRTFTDVYTRLKKDYVVKVSDKKLMENAIRGMLAGLDPHSAYLDPDEFHELQIGTTGEFGGLGIEVGMEDGFVKVIAPIDDTPADRAGIKAGDLIVRLNKKPVKGMSLDDAVNMMRGKKGTNITLTIVREGVEKPLTISITRDIIRVQSVKAQLLEPEFGYVRITNFQAKTTQSLIDAIEKLKQENGGELKGLVLDLRNNPGGVLNGAVGVSDAFLNDGLIVYTEGRDQNSELRYSATEGDVLNGAPMVVLINGGSASASEIVAGAMQDDKRAIIMGSKSFGKGSVQTILPLSNGAALKLTTARYYTPSGRSIQAEGIEPDIPLENLTVTGVGDSGVAPLTEADLAGHLTNDTTNEGTEGQNETKEVPSSPLAKQDYQLQEALNLLKGISIVRQQQD